VKKTKLIYGPRGKYVQGTSLDVVLDADFNLDELKRIVELLEAGNEIVWLPDGDAFKDEDLPYGFEEPED
jgi:hypothetical protein